MYDARAWRITMSHGTQLQSLIDYNRWANERVLAAADGASDEEFSRKGEDGLSIEGALGHAVRTQIWWLGNWTGADVVDLERSREGLRRGGARPPAPPPGRLAAPRG